MTVPKDHIILAIGWILFCVLHSVFASGKVKRYVAAKHNFLNKYYRLFYTLFALITFIIMVVYEIRLSSSPVLNSSFKSLGYIVGIAGIIIMLVCIKKYFIGLTGIKALIQNRPFESKLEINGIHTYMRHPLYLGTFLFIWGLFFVIPNLSVLISNTIIMVYTIIGISFEELKLEAEFGDVYKSYKKQVPRLIPRFSRKGQN